MACTNELSAGPSSACPAVPSCCATAWVAVIDDDAAARAAAVEGFVDLCLRYRKEIQVIYSDLAEWLQDPAFQRVRLMTEHICAVLAGPSGTLGSLVAAKLVLAGIPVIVSHIDQESRRDSDDELRAALVEAATRSLTPLTRD